MKTTNRYLVATCGVLLHLMLGSTYAWSIYRNPIMVQTGWDQSSVSFAFSLAIFCLGLSAAFMGRLVEKFGPRVTGSMSAVLYAGGNILTGVAIAQGELWILYLGYGILGGLGLGVGYITPVSTIIKWFPDKRGLATGLAIMGFGFASLLTSPIAQYLIQARGVEQTFYILGVVYFIVMLFVSQFIKRPSVEEAQLLADKSPNRQAADLSKGITANEALKSSTFYWLWLILFINISCGLALVSAISPMAQDMAGMSAESAAVVVGVMGIFNGFGRLLWAGLSDYIGRPKTFILLFVVNIVMAILLIVLQVPLVFVVLMSCYGAGFSLIPPYLSDIFGAKELATLHGYILTAWAMAALVGPMLLSVTYELTKSYQMTLLVFIALYVVALVIAYLLKKKVIRQSSLMMRI